MNGRFETERESVGELGSRLFFSSRKNTKASLQKIGLTKRRGEGDILSDRKKFSGEMGEAGMGSS